MKSNKRYRDTLHGFEAVAPSQMMAWALIRNECHIRKVQVPTFDQIKLLDAINNE